MTLRSGPFSKPILRDNGPTSIVNAFFFFFFFFFCFSGFNHHVKTFTTYIQIAYIPSGDVPKVLFVEDGYKNVRFRNEVYACVKRTIVDTKTVQPDLRLPFTVLSPAVFSVCTF